jgi:hypothetical protein
MIEAPTSQLIGCRAMASVSFPTPVAASMAIDDITTA